MGTISWSSTDIIGIAIWTIAGIVALVAALKGRPTSSAGTSSANKPELVSSNQKEPGWVVGLGFLLLVGLLWFAGGFVAVWVWPDSDWTNKWRYSLDDDLKDATIVVGPIPHDCEFLTSPLGSKHCHYEKQVATIRIRTDASGRLVSVDEGKTWAKAQPFDKPAVYVTWNKILD